MMPTERYEVTGDAVQAEIPPATAEQIVKTPTPPETEGGKSETTQKD